MPRKLTEKRALLLAQLEQIIGSSCYNGSIRDSGPNGVQYRDGREFRYPLAMIDLGGDPIKRRNPAIDVAPEVLD